MRYFSQVVFSPKTLNPNVASVEQIRAHFPALKRIHNGAPVAYFDGPGGTQVPTQVGEAITQYLYHHNANTHWAYPSSAETDQMLEEARTAFADFLNASPYEIAFGANMTTLTMHLGRALGRELQPNDEIVVTELDHHANIDPWRRLANEAGLKVMTARMNTDSGQIDWAHLESVISSKTKILAIGAASNALGTINDLPRAVALGHAVGAYVFVDAVHYAPHKLVDVKTLDCDFLACSAYKFYGPHVGILYGKHELLESLDVTRLVPAPNEHGERLETGTQNHEGIMGAAAAVDFLANLYDGPETDRRKKLAIVFDELDRRGHTLLTLLWKKLEEIPGVTLYGPSPNYARTSTLSFTINGLSSEHAAEQLAALGVFVSHGDFYATTVVDRLGLAEAGLIRAGCACYTTEDEILRLCKGVESIQK